jgi:hypothetical protein
MCQARRPSRQADVNAETFFKMETLMYYYRKGFQDLYVSSTIGDRVANVMAAANRTAADGGSPGRRARWA